MFKGLIKYRIYQQVSIIYEDRRSQGVCAMLFSFLFRMLIGLVLFISLHKNALAETIYVKYRAEPIHNVQKHFEEPSLRSSSLVKRVLYDVENSYLLVKLKHTFYHYCGLPIGVYRSWISTSSLGKFYLIRIKGQFSCRYVTHPEY